MYPNLTELLDALMAPVTNTAHPASAGPVQGGVAAAGARTGTGMLPAEVRP
jgi:hypothetical protein